MDMKPRTAIMMVATLLSGAAFAGHDGEEVGMLGKRLMRALDLSAEQAAQVKEIRSKNKTAIAPLRTKVKKMREELLTALQDPQKGADYQKGLTQKFTQLEAARAELNRGRFQVALEIREILSPEQMKKIKGLKAFRGMHHGGADKEDDEK
jgi:Spy/CpxP family protein refolding chaperone